jgi:hypothetical protein
MYHQAVRELIAARAFPDPDEIHGCTLGEVERLESALGAPLPASIREFVLWCGKGLGTIWSGVGGLDYDELLQRYGLEAVRHSLAEDGLDAALLEGPVMLFQLDPDGQFSFVRLDQGDDPPVFTRTEGGPLVQSADRFSDYVRLIVEQEFGIDGVGSDTMAEGQTGDPTARPGGVGVLPPELASQGGLAEVSFGFLPPSVQRDLGALRASFQPSAANAFAALVLGLLLVGGGLTLMALGIREAAQFEYRMPWVSSREMSWGVLGLLEALSAGVAACGALLIRQGIRLTRSRVFVGEAGVCRQWDTRCDIIHWSQVRQVEEVVLQDHPPVSTPWRRFIPVGSSRRYILHSRDGRELSFDSNSVRSFHRFESILRHAAALHRLPWTVVKLDA